MVVTIKNYNGLKNILKYDVENISRINIEENNNIVTINTEDNSGESTSKSYDITIENVKFLGLSLTPFTLNTYFKSNVGWKDYFIGESIVLYEMYAPITDVETPSDNIGIICYINTAEQNRVDKSDFLVKIMEIRGTFRDGFSVTEPSIIITSNTPPTFNYVKIPVLSNRYYYVNSIVNISKNIWEIYLTVDVLMSYKEHIYNLKAFVDRNEFEYNPDVINKDIVVKQGYTVNDLYIANYVFTADNASSFVLSGLSLQRRTEE